MNDLRKELERNWLEGSAPWPLLKPFGFLYGLAADVRRRFYGTLFQITKAEKPVIAIGNLTVGGSGKTPVCLALAEMLMAKGFVPAVLSRGYGRNNADMQVVVSRGEGPLVSPDDAGDEPWMMADRLKGLRVVADADRANGAGTAVRELGADILLLDDGFQQMGLTSDCRILLLPAAKPFGNGAIIPAGPLRERLEGHSRAHILINTGTEHPTEEALRLADGRPVFAARYQARGWRPFGNEEMLPPESLAGKRAFAFCGLGRPDTFASSLAGLGLRPVSFKALNDHQKYGHEELENLGLAFLASGAEVMVTTAKDAVKLPPSPFPWPLMVLEADMVFDRPEELMNEVLACCERKGQ